MNLCFYDSSASNKENLAIQQQQQHDQLTMMMMGSGGGGVIMMNPNSMINGGNNFVIMETTAVQHQEVTDLTLNDEDDESMPMSPASFGGHNTSSSNFSDLSFSSNMSSSCSVPSSTNNNNNSHTFRKTEWDVKKLEKHIKSYFGGDESTITSIELISPPLLKSYIDHFVEYARKSDGMEYEPESLVGYMNSFERYLKTKNYPESLLNSELFADTRAILRQKKQLVKQIGRLVRVKNTTTTGVVDMTSNLLKFYRNLFKEKHLLTRDTPDCLLAEVYLNNLIYFGEYLKEDNGLRGNLNMSWGDLVLEVDPENGLEYLTVSSRLVRQRGGSGQHLSQICQNSYDMSQRMNAAPRVYSRRLSSPNDCPIEAYKLFKLHRPSSCMEAESPFYLSPNNQRSAKSNPAKCLWYQSVCMTCQRLDPVFYCLFKRANVDLASLLSMTREQQEEMSAAAHAHSLKTNDFVVWKSREKSNWSSSTSSTSSLIALPSVNNSDNDLVPTSIIQSCMQQQVNSIVINGQAYPVMTQTLIGGDGEGIINLCSAEQTTTKPTSLLPDDKKKSFFKMPIQIQVQIQAQVWSNAQRDQYQQQLNQQQQQQQLLVEHDTSLSLLP